jgi:hypothetical protein
MARVAGMKEKLHMPLYDARFLDAGQQIPGSERVMRFFVDVQGKTRLETNMQAAGVLPSQNSFEARGMRVVLSSLFERDANGTQINQGIEAGFLSELIYNSVTTLLVGEKTMIEMPTYWFPAGAGVSPGVGTQANALQNHGEPNHLNSFRFAEPVPIDPQQNFRVEINFPLGVPPRVQSAVGPFRIWVVLDGYLTRDVQ